MIDAEYLKGNFEGREVLGLRLNWAQALHHARSGRDVRVRLQGRYDGYLVGQREAWESTSRLIPPHLLRRDGHRHLPSRRVQKDQTKKKKTTTARTGRVSSCPLDYIIGGSERPARAGRC